MILLSDLFLANSSEPWLIPDVESLPTIDPAFAAANGHEPFEPYARNADGARPWAVPGTPGLEHRIGGIEKSQPSGGISYEPANHQQMTDQRRERIAGIEVAPLIVDADPEAELLVLGWGSSWGTLRAAVRRLRDGGHPIAHAHFRNLNPLPANTGEVLARFKRVLVAEMNDGQLVRVLRADFWARHRQLRGHPGAPAAGGGDGTRAAGQAMNRSPTSRHEFPSVEPTSMSTRGSI